MVRRDLAATAAQVMPVSVESRPATRRWLAAGGWAKHVKSITWVWRCPLLALPSPQALRRARVESGASRGPTLAG